MIEDRKKLDHNLPAVAVTGEMAEVLRHIAVIEGVSVSTVMRSAFKVFLSQYDSAAIETKENQS